MMIIQRYHHFTFSWKLKIHMNQKYTILLFLFLYTLFTASTCNNKEPIKPSEPIANFETEFMNNGIVKFTNKSQNATDFLWDFGNNLKSSAKDTTVKYIKNSKYLIKLVAKTKDGKESIKQLEISVTNVEIPNKMSFIGTLGTSPVSFIDGENNSKITNQYESCCANYSTQVYSNYGLSNHSRNLNFYISQSQTGFNSNKQYSDIVANIFKIGYSQIGQLTTGYAQTGMWIGFNINGQSSTLQSKKLIEVVEVLKDDNQSCSCDKENIWVKYKIEVENLKGILTLKYQNPCCQ